MYARLGVMLLILLLMAIASMFYPKHTYWTRCEEWYKLVSTKNWWTCLNFNKINNEEENKMSSVYESDGLSITDL